MAKEFRRQALKSAGLVSVLTFAALLVSISEIRGIPKKSLLPVLLGGEQERPPLYWEKHLRPKLGGKLLQAVRIDGWKAIRKGKKQPIMLYDLETDRGEQLDLSARHPDVVKRLKKLMKKSRRESDIWPSK